ncbi:toxic anion resistance protein [Rarobacter incanus]|uniref:Uncharacterized protein YaaN involved in tellurite resistance n=1 Tax=Rarobacter incanus TaxID=153494 RepID=A0A542SRG4_9MICO|nr:toxic anion resistance protein [Rarobacter incanus]TQK77209.1 uncharacterized protein YaaN involved in tellurite resistance [Rarobacter incanus]
MPQDTVTVDFAALMETADARSEEAQGSPLENAMAEVPPTDVAAATPAAAVFTFRSLLSDKQRADLEHGAPGLAKKFIADVNQIVSFGAPIMKKMNDASTQLLEVQRSITVPQADAIVNDLLREMDGFEKKWRSVKLESAAETVKGWFKKTKYTLKTMIRESKPITDRIDMAELKLQEMETALADNIARGQLLHKQSLAHMDDVVAVLAALEQVIEVIRAEFAVADAALRAAEAHGGDTAEHGGATVTVSELREAHANLSFVLSETEKTWADWRSQFFLGFAHAPATRNLIVTTFALRRRLAAFRTMGLPSARQSLALWQQAAFAKEGAQLGAAVQEGTNKLIQGAFQVTAESIEVVANAAQAPVITEETIWVVIDSVKAQCASIVQADKAGRALRARNLQALETGEAQIEDAVIASQRALADAGRTPIGVSPGSESAREGSTQSDGTGTDPGGDLLNKLID